MDRGVRDRIVKGRPGMGAAALVLLALLAADAGCNRYAAVPPPMPSPASEDLEAARPDAREGRDASPTAVPVWLPPAVAVNGAGRGADAPPGDNAAVDRTAADNAAIEKTATENAADGIMVAGRMATAGPAASAPPVAKEEPGVPASAENGRSAAPPSNQKPKPADAAPPIPAVATDPRGNVVVTWQSAGSPGNDHDSWSVQGRRFGADGRVLDPQFQANTWTTDSQQLPAAGVDALGNFVVAWSSFGSSGSDTAYDSVQAQRYDGILRDGFETGDTTRWSSTAP